MKKFLVATVLAAALIAHGSNAQQAQSPLQQAISAKFATDGIAKLECDAGLIAAQARIKELEAKLAAAEKPEEKKP